MKNIFVLQLIVIVVELNMLSDPFTTLFKKGSIKAMRAITAMDMNSPEIVERVSTEVWKKIWIHDLDITDEAVLMDAFAKAGLSEEQGREFLGLASTKAVKNKLKENTEEALDAGCFGAPSFIVRQEGEEDKMFFGQGSFLAFKEGVNRFQIELNCCATS